MPSKNRRTPAPRPPAPPPPPARKASTVSDSSRDSSPLSTVKSGGSGSVDLDTLRGMERQMQEIDDVRVGMDMGLDVEAFDGMEGLMDVDLEMVAAGVGEDGGEVAREEEEDGDEEEDDDNAEDDEEEDEDDEEEEEDDSDDEDQGDLEGGQANISAQDEGEQSPAALDVPEEDEEDNEAGPSTLQYHYPPAPSAEEPWESLSERTKSFKVARFVKCTEEDCDCEEMVPPDGSGAINWGNDPDSGAAGRLRVDGRTKEGWWESCGECGHGWGEGGHCWQKTESPMERSRKGKVIGRIEELLQDADMLCSFPTPKPEFVTSLLKQLHHFVRPPAGKKPILPISGMTPPTDSPFTPRDGMTPGGSDDEDDRPRKRSRHDDDERNDLNAEDISRHGKKPGGKTAGKGTKPRTVVRGVRGLVPMEIDADGNQHIGGRLPESAIAADGGEAVDVDLGAGDDDEEDIPLAKRPQLDEGERRRREVIKEKEREREEEVVRRLTKGVNVDTSTQGLGGQAALPGVDVWEGVELVQLPLRPAAIEQARREIILQVVSSLHPDEKDTVLLIGLKNLFQRQLPKMPREYITRLVLDKNHISVAIVKRGWKVVGGICYRPFVGRSFAEIVFCAVDSSEQIKGYGSHLMNSLKDHVKRAHPTIDHFLTYADNYAVGYFKKQGFTKDITLPREKWVGYIKDYEGGTIMQCTMLPKIRYLEVHQMLADQKAAVLAKIRTISKSHVIRPGLAVFKDRKPGGEVKLAKNQVPGLAESGWDPELDAIIRQPKPNPHHLLLQQVLNDLRDEPSSWPFTKPVDRKTVLDYYKVITHPMDLATMEEKLENNHYKGIDDFMIDAKLIFANCRQYNGDKNTYAVQANRLEKALERIMKKRKQPVGAE